MPTVSAVRLCRSVPWLFFPCRVIQPNAVQPAERESVIKKKKKKA